MSQYVPSHNHLLDQSRVLPGKEEMAPLTGRATWMDGEHLLEITA